MRSLPAAEPEETRVRRLLTALSALALATVTLGATAACAPTPATRDDGVLRILSSTDVYGDIAEQIAGDLAEVTSVIEGARNDPHSYEVSARDQLAYARADIVIRNGGGYDPFMTALAEAPSTSGAPIILDVAEIAGVPAGGNEHVWYDFVAVETFATRLAAALAEADATNAAVYTANSNAFLGELQVLAAEAETIRTSRRTGEPNGVAVTEPVPVALLAAVGLDNQTPNGFSEAIEEGGDVPPTDLADLLERIRSGSIVLLAYNTQTASPETERVRLAAEAAGVPIVDFTETLPDGLTYLSWMGRNLSNIAEAL